MLASTLQLLLLACGIQLLAACQGTVPPRVSARLSPRVLTAVIDPPSSGTRPATGPSTGDTRAADAVEGLRRAGLLTARAAIALDRNVSTLSAHGGYLRQVSDLLQNRLAAQNAALLAASDPEARVRGLRVVAFNADIASFLADLCQQADTPERRALLDWALSPAHAETVALAYDQDPDQRSRAVARLAALRGPFADIILARLMRDDDRATALRALDVAFDRPASAALVGAAWDKAVGDSFRLRAQNSGIASSAAGPQTRVITVVGRPITIQEQPINNAVSPDDELATDLLLKQDSPLVRRRLEAFVQSLANARSDNAFAVAFSPNYGTTAINFLRLARAYRPAHLIPFLVGAVENGDDNSGYTQNMNGINIRVSTRIDLLTVIIELTGQDKSAYGLVHIANWGNRDVLIGDEATEDAAAKMLLIWWKANYKQFGATSPALAPMAHERLPSDGIISDGIIYGSGE